MATPEDNLNKALSDAATFLMGGAGICTHFVLIAEYVDENGEYNIATLTDGESRPWIHHGMVSYALENNLVDFDEEYEDEVIYPDDDTD